MPELHDFDLGGRGSASSPSPPEPPRRRSGYLPYAAVGLVVAAAIVGLFWFLSREVSPPAPTAPSEAEAPSATGEETAGKAREAPVEPLPPLSESDDFVRRQVGALGSDPALAGWLAPTDLVERFAASVENIGLGASPASHLAALAPKGDFEVQESDGRLVATPATYARYDLVTRVFTALDPRACAQVYRRLRPLLQEAYAALGYPDGDFDEAVAGAVGLLLDTPVPAEPPALEAMVSSYRYVDPALESLPAAQKQFLRFGSDNMRRVKAQLRRLADELELDLR